MKLVYSTMTRATETAKIILGKLEDAKDIEHCDLLREGAPIPPEPPLGSWKPEVYVSEGIAAVRPRKGHDFFVRLFVGHLIVRCLFVHVTFIIIITTVSSHFADHLIENVAGRN